MVILLNWCLSAAWGHIHAVLVSVSLTIVPLCFNTCVRILLIHGSVQLQFHESKKQMLCRPFMYSVCVTHMWVNLAVVKNSPGKAHSKDVHLEEEFKFFFRKLEANNNMN
jgi:hypothetical protein